MTAKTKKSNNHNGRNDLKELKEEVLAMENSTSNGEVRDALRGVMEKIEAHQHK